MTSRFALGAAIALITASASVFFAVTLLSTGWFAFGEEITASNPDSISTSSTSSVSIPVRLQIPTLHIDAQVQQVGTDAKGNLGVPTNFRDVAWYKNGPIPGGSGSAVIDGHVDNALSLPGVFKHLNEIQIGDDIYVLAKDGRKLHFSVVEVESYPYDQAPKELIFQRTGEAGLNLITCEGTWIKKEKTYDKRLVVFSRLVTS